MAVNFMALSATCFKQKYLIEKENQKQQQLVLLKITESLSRDEVQNICYSFVLVNQSSVLNTIHISKFHFKLYNWVLLSKQNHVFPSIFSQPSDNKPSPLSPAKSMIL